jgi:hypothetical protein
VRVYLNRRSILMAALLIMVGIGLEAAALNGRANPHPHARTAQAPQTLAQVNFHGGALAPYFRLKPANKGGRAMFILSREARGPSKGLYDFFGGKRDPGEKHPVFTASREGAEESVYLLGRPATVRRYIDSTGPNTHDVVVRNGYVAYLTKYSPAAVTRLFRNFAGARRKTNNPHLTEKDRLATITWGALATVIRNAPQPLAGPVRVKATVLNARGRGHTETITLRPLVVGALRSFFKGTGCRNGLNPKVHFCS